MSSHDRLIAPKAVNAGIGDHAVEQPVSSWLDRVLRLFRTRESGAPKTTLRHPDVARINGDRPVASQSAGPVGADPPAIGVKHTIGLVLTGGTIGAEGDDDSVLSIDPDSAAPEARLVKQHWPGNGPVAVEVRQPIRQLSENLVPSDWLVISGTVRQLADIPGVRGVLVLHGTDTMAYTAAALSFLLSDLRIPIVLTGSLIPSGERRSDAARNVETALIAMCSLSAGTYVSFAGTPDAAGRVHLGTRVRKVRASERAFRSINREFVGRVHGRDFEFVEPYRAPPRTEDFVERIDDRVLALRLYPGLDFEVAHDAVCSKETRGVIVELYPSATGPTDTADRYSVTKFIRQCTDRGVVVVTTVPERAPALRSVYSTTVAINEAGGLFLGDMLSEAATVKLMWALAQRSDPQAVRELMRTPIAGELNPSESELARLD